MIESPIGSIQKVESNCNKKLEIFISNLNRHANTLKKNVSQLQQISARLLAKSQQFVRLNETETDEDKYAYSVDQRNFILSEVISQANADFIAANGTIKELLFLYDELSADYRNLLTAANVLQMLTDKSVVIAGDSKQRPISYYIDEGCRILYIWNIYQKSSEKLLANIDIRNNESVKEFSKFIESPTDLTHKLEDYLLYCTFILAAK